MPFGPASGADITARLVADRLAARWGKPVVVENRPGGDGLVAIGAFIGANDDHTLLFGPAGTFAVHPYEHEKLPYDAERDLLPIASVTTIILAVSASGSLNVGSLGELVALIRAQPGKLNAAAANGNADFLLFGFLKSSGLQVAKVPYRDIHAGAERSRRGPHPSAGDVAGGGAAADAGRQGQGAGGDQPPARPSAPDVPTVGRGRLPGAGAGQSHRRVRAARHAARAARAHRRGHARRWPRPTR